jgi:exodeoxyribonuclease III
MKIVSWNINSIRLRKELVKEFITIESPQVLAFQETKCEDSQFPAEYFSDLGYKHQFFIGEKSYNGVAIISKIPIEKKYNLEIYNSDKRHVCCQIADIEIHNFYVPAGGDIPDINTNPKFLHKLEFVKFIKEWFPSNKNKNDKIILLGDLNIAPFENDVWSSRQLKNIVSHTDIEREILLDAASQFEWVDSARKFINKNEKSYSWWSYRNRDWKKSNRGRRLDHIWASRSLENLLKSYSSFPEFRDKEKPSDHVPIMINLS